MARGWAGGFCWWRSRLKNPANNDGGNNATGLEQRQLNGHRGRNKGEPPPAQRIQPPRGRNTSRGENQTRNAQPNGKSQRSPGAGTSPTEAAGGRSRGNQTNRASRRRERQQQPTSRRRQRPDKGNRPGGERTTPHTKGRGGKNPRTRESSTRSGVEATSATD